MKDYDYLLFDLDDTILDFQSTQIRALKRIHATYALHIEEGLFIQTYGKVNHQLWTKYENNEIKKDEIIQKRFSMTFEELAIDALGSDAVVDYQNYLGEGTELLESARQTLELCKESGYKMYVVSNGEYHTQMKRLEGADLIRYFDAIYVSEMTGSQKPNRAFFDYVCKHSPEVDKTKALIIGDSLTSDIEGAKNAKMDSCWYNGFDVVSNNEATYEVTNHSELQSLLVKHVNAPILI